MKKRSNENGQLFCKQRNKCVYHSLRKAEKDYFASLSEKHITANKCFWKDVKPFLSNKVQSSERIELAEEDDTLIRYTNNK